MTIPSSASISDYHAKIIFAHLLSERVSSWQSFSQVCGKVELYLATIGRSRLRDGSADPLFARLDSGGIDLYAETFQVIRLGAGFFEHSGQPYDPMQLMGYFATGGALRAIMLATMSHADFSHTPFSDAAKGHMSGETSFPDVPVDGLQQFLVPLSQRYAWFNPAMTTEYLAKTFGPISPNGRKKIYAAYGQIPPTNKKARRKDND
ncbi:MAG: hypothetical protein HY053_05315, partial [Proteobacteria bacterium]|nr:hypothetical protein [Pseudomonadota bacterium]